MTKRSKPSVIIDTNLLISAIIVKGDNTPNKLLELWRKDRYLLCLSDELLLEIKQVLLREKIYKKYHISQEEIDTLISNFRKSTTFISPVKLHTLPVHSRDKKDDILHASALGGNCDYLITGDKDLLVLRNKPAISQLKIITASEFLNLLD